MSEVRRVLHIFGRLGLGGAESRTMDLYRRIDRTVIQFDFLVHTQEEEFYDAEAQALGARIYRVPRFNGRNLLTYRRALQQLFETHRGTWSAVHGHMTSTAAFYLPIARRNGVPLTIAHARSAGVDPGFKGFVTRLLRLPLSWRGFCDLRLACTREAGISVFGRRRMEAGDVLLWPNAIDLSQYHADRDAGERMRAAFGIPDGVLVIGHVGSFRYAKNHEYLLRICAALKAQGTDVRLLLIGDGERRGQIEALSEELGIRPQTIFAGNRGDVADCLQAVDVFVFPSRYEGLPGSVIEAQASGLPCLISDRISTEVDITALVERRSIDENPAQWAGRILALRSGGSGEIDSAQIREQLRAAGYDVDEQAGRLQEIYQRGK